MKDKETKDLLLTIAKILPVVPVVPNMNINGYRSDTYPMRSSNGKLKLANHSEMVSCMYNSGGLFKVKQYCDLTYYIADVFYGKNRLYSKLIAH